MHLASAPGPFAISGSDEATETLYHLRVDDEWAPPFWLDLEMRGAAPLEALDSYLRSIWLECCGHLSQFTTGGWGSRDLSTSRTADAVFSSETELVHLYDFGTTSETRIRVMDEREGAPTAPWGAHSPFRYVASSPSTARASFARSAGTFTCTPLREASNIMARPA